MQEYNIPNICGAMVGVILTAITLKKGIDGISKINLILIPFIIISVCLLLIKSGKSSVNDAIYISNSKWILNSILYASYNSIILIPIIINLNKTIKDKNAKWTVILGTLIITVILSFIIFILIYKNYNELKNIQLPIIYLAGKLGSNYKLVYSTVILSAIFTTAISSGYSFLINLSENKKQYNLWLIGISLLGIVLTPIGFGKLLDLLYPILGYLGLTQIFLVLIKT